MEDTEDYEVYYNGRRIDRWPLTEGERALLSSAEFGPARAVADAVAAFLRERGIPVGDPWLDGGAQSDPVGMLDAQT